MRAAVAVALSVASGWWLWHAVDTRAVFELLRRVHLPTLVLAVSLLMASLTAKALRWRALMPRPGLLSAPEAVRIFHVSVLVNNLLPFRLGDGVRVIAAPVRRVLTRRQAVSVLIAERLVDAVVLGACALIVLPRFVRADPTGATVLRAPRLGGVEGGALLAAALVLAGAWLGWRAARGRGGRAHRWVTAFVADLRIVARMGKRQAGVAAGLTALAWTGTFALHYALLTAIGIQGSLTLAVVVTLATNVSMLVPAAPANVGLAHAAGAAPLVAWGLPADLSVAYAVLVHAVNTVPPTLVGLGCLVMTGLPSRTPQPAAADTALHGIRVTEYGDRDSRQP